MLVCCRESWVPTYRVDFFGRECHTVESWRCRVCRAGYVDAGYWAAFYPRPQRDREYTWIGEHYHRPDRDGMRGWGRQHYPKPYREREDM